MSYFQTTASQRFGFPLHAIRVAIHIKYQYFEINCLVIEKSRLYCELKSLQLLIQLIKTPHLGVLH